MHKSIRNNNNDDICFIYINNESSRKINTRKKNEYVKSYETYENLIFKNSILEAEVDKIDIDKEINEWIEAIDQYIDADIKVLNILKNNILIKEEINNIHETIMNCKLKLAGVIVKSNYNQKHERKFVTEISIYTQNTLDVNLKSIVVTMDDDIICANLYTLIMVWCVTSIVIN